MIVGVGIDLTEVSRIAKIVDRHGKRFLNRIYTDAEQAYSLSRGHPPIHLAARFAAKEAMLKALAVPQGLNWHEMEVKGGGNRKPELVLTGRALDAANQLGATRVHLSISHTADVAAAFIVLERGT